MLGLKDSENINLRRRVPRPPTVSGVVAEGQEGAGLNIGLSKKLSCYRNVLLQNAKVGAEKPHFGGIQRRDDCRRSVEIDCCRRFHARSRTNPHRWNSDKL